jgi:GTP-binding protein Era
VDLILYVVDASVPPGSGEEYIINNLMSLETPIFLVLNKIDLVDEGTVLGMIQLLTSKMDFAEVIPVSAAKKGNLDRLMDVLFDYLPEGPIYYPEDDYTDQSERFIVAEYIREKALYLTREEVPHSLAVEIEEFETRHNLIYIRAAIYTERDSQKGIIIGKNGSMLKKIGEMARHDIEKLLGCQVYLELWVKVKKDWRNSEAQLKNLGYRY